MIYYGGTVLNKDILSLKKIIFRSTRGKAVITLFDLVVNENDQVKDDNFHRERSGYIILVEDQAALRLRVEKVCKQFLPSEQGKVFQITPKTLVNDLKDQQDEKLKMREMLINTKTQFYDYMSKLLLPESDYHVIAVYKQFMYREMEIYKVMNGA